MLGTFAFAEQPFAALSYDSIVGKVKVAGTVSKKKKTYQFYRIHGKDYRLTEQEYYRYQLQKQAVEAELKDKSDSELLDLMEDAEEGNIPNRLSNLIKDPVFKVYNLEIPLIPDGLLEKVSYLANYRLLEKIRKEQEMDDEMAIQLLIMHEFS